MQRNAADQLDVEVAHLLASERRFADRCKGFRQQRIELRALGKPGSELLGRIFEFVVRQRRELRFEHVDFINDLAHALEFTAVLRAKDLSQQCSRCPSGEKRRQFTLFVVAAKRSRC